MRVVLHQAWSEGQWTALMRYLTISTNIKHLFSEDTSEWAKPPKQNFLNTKKLKPG